ncbi:MAG: right-handed parallel beta-helix repeat-containing protein [Armatimonadetes bacterium]|nr:right-handed parallel beta-helix repeat-containing protein [Armatimonadota bacterium]
MIQSRWMFGLTTALLPLLLVSASISEGRFVGMRLDNGALVPNPPPYDPNNPDTGLQKAFPTEIVQPADNPTTPEKVELGKLLFFDPILSDDNTLSCAHCHHPHLGFSDGLPRSRGRGGKGAGRERTGGIELTRGAPSLWNTVYYHRQFWDGRAAHLEEQARMVITTPEEVNADPAELVRELKAIPEYRALFDKAFGGKDGEAITFKNITYAIAAFQRTLVSFNSRFDRYAAGDGSALSPQEKRGLKLFLSPKTRCNECHGIPVFADRNFKVIGVPDPKDGPADVAKPEAERGRGGGPNGAFKIPTLRNIALTAPYMHNGAFETLEEVLDFYAGGGGRGVGLDVPLQDDKIRKFNLTPQEKADLIAFLLALTDESALPQIPQRVPSGLPVVQPQVPRQPTRLNLNSPELRRIQQLQRRAENTLPTTPAPRKQSHSLKTLAVQQNPPSPPLRRGVRGDSPSHARVVEVRPGESIQEAVDKAGRNGVVRIYPGTYHENVLVIHHGVTIEGVIRNGKRPVLDGRNLLPDAISGLGNDFKVMNLEIRNYQGNGVVVHKARNVVYRNLILHNTGLYGVYPIECDGVLVEDCKVSGTRDAGIYVGQSRNIVVRRNEAFQNVTGIEIENCVNAIVEDNYVHNNTGGILVFLLPFNPSKVQDGCIVRRNRVINNNTPNFADPEAIVSNVLKGTGIMLLAADNTEVYENEIVGNGTFGIMTIGLRQIFPAPTPLDVDPSPDGNRIYNNTLRDNGKDPDERLKRFGIPPVDLLWDMTGKGNTWNQPEGTRFPPALPSGT